MSTTHRPTKAELKKARGEAARAAAAAAARRSRNIRVGLWSAISLVVLAAVVVVAVVTNRPQHHPSATQTSGSTASPSEATGAPGGASSASWPAPRDASAAVAAAGLPMLGAEGSALHIHAHLDVIVNGAAVTVPAELGIDEARHQISPLHSHDTTCVIHVESPDPSASFTLGQFFTEWQVPLATDHIGGLTGDATHHLKAYVNGTLYPGDPAGIVLMAHQEIALVYGADSQQPNVPTSYTWTGGL
jgi:hypothetical protein